MQELFRRYERVSGVEYEILSSNKKTYYTVPLVAGHSAGCECKHAQFNPTCKHQTEAKKQERLYQERNQKPKNAEQEKRLEAPLNGDRTFSILR